MNSSTESYWQEFVRTGAVSDYLRYVESVKQADDLADAEG